MVHIDEIMVRKAGEADIEDIAALFDSSRTDSNYNDPYFNSVEAIQTGPDRCDKMLARLVAVHGDRIVGFSAAEDFGFGGKEDSDGKIAEEKKLFVHPDYRGKPEGKPPLVVGGRVSDKLAKGVEEQLGKLGYDAIIGSAVCGHKGSQELAAAMGYFPVAFAPMWAKADFTNRGQRESMLFMLRYLNPEFEKYVRAQRTVHVPPELRGATGDFYKLEGLWGRRSLATWLTADDISVILSNPRNKGLRNGEEVKKRYAAELDEQVSSGGGAIAHDVMPVRLISISGPEGFLRVGVCISKGWTPTGVIPLGRDFVRMQYKPHGLHLDASKVQIIERAKPLFQFVTRHYMTG